MTTITLRGTRVPEQVNEPGTWSVEASSLGLAPGEWPDRLEDVIDARGMEPELPVEFDLQRLVGDPDGNVQARYASRLGTMHLIVVYND